LSRPLLIKQLKEKNPQLNRLELENILDIFCNGIKKALLDGKNVEIRGFGTFSKKYVSPRKFVNPKTKEVSFLGETEIIHFKPSKKLTKVS